MVVSFMVVVPFSLGFVVVRFDRTAAPIVQPPPRLLGRRELPREVGGEGAVVAAVVSDQLARLIVRRPAGKTTTRRPRSRG
jgi:hypothetical protein